MRERVCERETNREKEGRERVRMDDGGERERERESV